MEETKNKIKWVTILSAKSTVGVEHISHNMVKENDNDDDDDEENRKISIHVNTYRHKTLDDTSTYTHERAHTQHIFCVEIKRYQYRIDAVASLYCFHVDRFDSVKNCLSHI